MTKRKSLVDQFISSEQSDSVGDEANKENNETSEQSSTQEPVNQEEEKVENVEAEQVQTQSVTIIQHKNQDLKPEETKENSIAQAKQYSTLEQYYLNRLNGIREKIDNPQPIDRLNKRRKYSADARRNVTFSIREDIALLIDDIVDDAKIFKGLFHDEVLDMGIRAFIEKHGLKPKDSI
jgi:hypothetical protein